MLVRLWNVVGFQYFHFENDFISQNYFEVFHSEMFKASRLIPNRLAPNKIYLPNKLTKIGSF